MFEGLISKQNELFLEWDHAIDLIARSWIPDDDTNVLFLELCCCDLIGQSSSQCFDRELPLQGNRAQVFSGEIGLLTDVQDTPVLFQFSRESSLQR